MNDFLGYDIALDVTKGAIRAVAHDAVDEATGARGLVTVLERTFRDLKVRRRRERPCAALFRARIVLLGTTFPLSDARAPRPPASKYELPSVGCEKLVSNKWFAQWVGADGTKGVLRVCTHFYAYSWP